MYRGDVVGGAGAPDVGVEGLADALLREAQVLDDERAPWDSMWDEIARHVMPRKGYVSQPVAGPDAEVEAELFDGTAVWANELHANGMSAWMHPFDAPWMRLVAPGRGVSGDVEKWYGECTEAMTEVLSRSNFHTEIHELHLERTAFGTCCIEVAEGGADVVRFQTHDVGTFSAAEGADGGVETVVRRFEMSAGAAAAKFSLPGDRLPEAVLQAAADPVKRHRKFWFRHVVKPRVGAGLGRPGVLGMPWASYWVSETGRVLVRESGFPERRLLVGTYLKWKRGPYGYGPGWRSLPDVKMLNHLQKHMAVLVETAAFPPVLVPAGFEGKVDMSAYGVTFYDDPSRMPQDWIKGRNYDFARDYLQMQQEAVKRSFAVEVFRMYQDVEKEMTATEVLERRAERMVQFSPTVGRFQYDILNPLLEAVFGICARRSLVEWVGGRDGVLPLPPEEMLQAGVLPPPNVEYHAKLALALRDHRAGAFVRVLEIAGQVAPVVPDVLDRFDMDEGMAEIARSFGVSEDVIRSDEEVFDRRKARAEQLAAAQVAAAAAGELSGA